MNNEESESVEKLEWHEILFSFEGRISRKQYWISFLIICVASILAGLLFQSNNSSIKILATIVYVVTCWGAIAVYAKRLHDRGKSGWWILVWLVPIIGALWLFIEMGFLKGNDKANIYGRPS